mmetsp:Transcript_68606/g.134731  ORF Transcript_68606/g.134731 Transcript_68606/m.134731 type:complete len:251 (-) Transcript_68606:682-1434(-)
MRCGSASMMQPRTPLSRVATTTAPSKRGWRGSTCSGSGSSTQTHLPRHPHSPPPRRRPKAAAAALSRNPNLLLLLSRQPPPSTYSAGLTLPEQHQPPPLLGLRPTLATKAAVLPTSEALPHQPRRPNPCLLRPPRNPAAHLPISGGRRHHHPQAPQAVHLRISVPPLHRHRRHPRQTREALVLLLLPLYSRHGQRHSHRHCRHQLRWRPRQPPRTNRCLGVHSPTHLAASLCRGLEQWQRRHNQHHCQCQ